MSLSPGLVSPASPAMAEGYGVPVPMHAKQLDESGHALEGGSITQKQGAESQEKEQDPERQKTQGTDSLQDLLAQWEMAHRNMVATHIAQLRRDLCDHGARTKEPEEPRLAIGVQAARELPPGVACRAAQSMSALTAVQGWTSKRDLFQPGSSIIISADQMPGGSGPETGGIIEKLARSTRCMIVCKLMVVVNAIVIGWESDWNVRATFAVIEAEVQGDASAFAVASAHLESGGEMFKILDKMFLVFFMCELLFNIIAYKMLFWIGSDWRWNWFDVIVVTVGAAQIMLSDVNVTFMRLLRLLRMVRLIRIMRVLRIFRHVRQMILSLAGSMVSLFWALVLILILVFVLGVFLMQGVSSYLEGRNSNRDPLVGDFTFVYSPSALTSQEVHSQMRHFYGGIWLTIRTIIMSFTGGIDWSESVDPIAQISALYALAYVSSIVFLGFGMLNILTGVFVQSAMSAAHKDSDNVMQSQLEDEESDVSALRLVFRNADVDNSGSLTLEEFEDHMSNESVRLHLRTIGINPSEARGLFELLDTYDSGMVGIEEFIIGCCRLKGEASSIDLATLMHENKKMSALWRRFAIDVQKRMDRLEHLMAKLDANSHGHVADAASI